MSQMISVIFYFINTLSTAGIGTKMYTIRFFDLDVQRLYLADPVTQIDVETNFDKMVAFLQYSIRKVLAENSSLLTPRPISMHNS